MLSDGLTPCSLATAAVEITLEPEVSNGEITDQALYHRWLCQIHNWDSVDLCWINRGFFSSSTTSWAQSGGVGCGIEMKNQRCLLSPYLLSNWVSGSHSELLNSLLVSLPGPFLGPLCQPPLLNSPSDTDTPPGLHPLCFSSSIVWQSCMLSLWQVCESHCLLPYFACAEVT